VTFITLTLGDGRETDIDADRIVSITDAKLSTDDDEVRKAVAWLDPSRNLDEISIAAMRRFVQERIRTAVTLDNGTVFEVQQTRAQVREVIRNVTDHALVSEYT
jgi:hypothetical protein